MFIESVGGLQIFGIEEKENKGIDIDIVLKSPAGDIEKESQFTIQNNKIANTKGLNNFVKIDLNRKLNSLNDIDIKIQKIDFENGKDQTLIDFSVSGKKFKNVLIDWKHVNNMIEIEAPMVSGDKVIDTRIFSDSVLDSYINYFLKAAAASEKTIANMNMILFFETVETQRIIHILNMLISLSLLLNYNGYKLIKRGYFNFSFKGIEFSVTFNVSNQFKVSADIVAKFNDNVYVISDSDSDKDFDTGAILSLLKNNMKDIEIVKFSNKNTNKKNFLYYESFFSGEDILFSLDNQSISNLLLSTDNIFLDKNGQITHVLNPEEKIKAILESIFFKF